MTGTELLLWSRLRGHRLGGHRFRRQAPLGPFVVDFACYASRLAVEIDGPAHEVSMRQDALRDAYLGRSGFRVLRFSADDVLQRLDDVLATILRECS
jgi:very-short-patch-repair endonuclease